jgi:hypothetical protein
MKTKKKDKASKGNRPKRDRSTQKHKQSNNDGIRRISRPMGLTGLCKEYNQTNDESLLQRIRTISVQDWAAHGFTFAGKPRTVEQIANMLDWSTKKVIQHVSAPVKNWLESYKVEDQYRVLLSFITQMGMSDRAQFQAQIDVLRREQGDTYVPFLTEQVNKALSLVNENTKTMLAIASAFKPTGPSIKVQQNTLVTNTDNPTTDHGRYLGVNEAVRLLEANRPGNLLETESLQQSVILEAVPVDVPEVIATRQQGLGVDGHDKPILKKTRKDHSDRLAKNAQIMSSPIIIP